MWEVNLYWYMITENIIDKYKKIYDLPELKYEEQASGDFFKLCNKKHYFVIVSIYNLKNEIFLIRDLNKTIGWELPGGHINDNESIEEAINRIVLNEAGFEIDELSPVAIVRNIFKYDDKAITHLGIAFMALSRGKLKPYPKNIQAYFVSNIPKKVVYQNDKVILMVRQKLSERKCNPPFEEIDGIKSKKSFLFYLLHRYFVKYIGNFSSRKIKKKIFALIDGKPKTILDVSCGDSSIINELYEKYKPNICVGNDISWKTITRMKNKNSAVFLTNHNVLDLPYKIKFDLVIFKNTLHHIEKRHQKELVDNLRDFAKQLIIVDINDPQNSTFRSKLWNDYYVSLLGDQGYSFLTFDQFLKMLGSKNIIGDRLKAGIINTIKGKYFYSTIKDQ